MAAKKKLPAFMMKEKEPKSQMKAEMKGMMPSKPKSKKVSRGK